MTGPLLFHKACSAAASIGLHKRYPTAFHPDANWIFKLESGELDSLMSIKIGLALYTLSSVLKPKLCFCTNIPCVTLIVCGCRVTLLVCVSCHPARVCVCGGGQTVCM